MTWRLQQIADWTGGELRGADPSAAISEIAVDSRRLIDPEALFVALEGPRFDGHDFVDDAFEQGARAALVHRTDNIDGDERALVVVDDTLAALQAFAARWRQQFDIPVVGITGSNGKTIVKDMLAAIVGQTMEVYRSPGSFNSQVGVALALLGIRAEHEVAIIEAGISTTGEMETLEEMIRPTRGILTNIGLAHAAGLGDLETTAREKRKLFGRCSGPVVVPADEPLVSEEMFHVKRLPVAGSELSSRDDVPVDSPTVSVRQLRRRNGAFDFRLQWTDSRCVEVSLNVPGRHNVDNAAQAAAMAADLGCDDDAIADGLAAYSLRGMRLEMHTTSGDVTLINDAYNADPTSTKAALDVLGAYAGNRRQIAILGDMLDLGGRATTAHRDVGRHIARLQLDRLFCIGDLAQQIAKGAQHAGMAPEHIRCVDDFDELHRLLDEVLEAGDVVLFKASRNIELDRAARRLVESVAPTRLYIDLEAIADNFHALRRHLGDDTGTIAVVKSFGYGNDATRISQTLIRQGVDALAVAYPDEAIPLRRRGISTPILVLNARSAEADKLVKYDLEPLVYTRRAAGAFARRVRHTGDELGVHIGVDTGMRRIGVRPKQGLDFAKYIEKLSGLSIAGVMTHFAVADNPEEDQFTAHQIAEFEQLLEDLRGAGIDPGVVHAANTAAAWRFPNSRYDMVRIGLGLYGLSPSGAVERQVADDVTPALKMTTRVLHLQRVEPGDTVGYGRTWRADQPRRLATIAAGYNDGIPYFLSNRGAVLIGGQRCDIVGSVCMDVTVVDVTDLEKVAVGDEAVLFGTQGEEAIHIDEWADVGDTINYELLCNISPRVRRIFLK